MSIMINQVEMKVILSTVKVTWTLPHVLPEYFKIQCSCIPEKNSQRTLANLLFGEIDQRQYIIPRHKEFIVIEDLTMPYCVQGRLQSMQLVLIKE